MKKNRKIKDGYQTLDDEEIDAKINTSQISKESARSSCGPIESKETTLFENILLKDISLKVHRGEFI